VKEAIFKVCSRSRKEFLVSLSLLCCLGCSCNGTAEPNSEKDLFTIDTPSKDQYGRTFSVMTGEGAQDQGKAVSPVPEATFSGFPGERVVVGGEEKRIWSTAPRGVSTPTPLPTYRVYPYVILPPDKTR